MKKLDITAHCLIRNEENWIWYAIHSVLNFVDNVIIFDTGSTDNTVPIIKTIHSPKILFEQKGQVNKSQYSALRQEMLSRTKTSWFLILDGDEIWFKKTLVELRENIMKMDKTKDAVVVGEWMCQGDIFHFNSDVERLFDLNAPELPGYRLARVVKKLPGLRVVGHYGVESYADKNGLNISNWPKERQIYLQNRFMHMSFLPRTSKRSNDELVMMRRNKTSFSRGKRFAENFQYPEVFYMKRPEIVPSPWRKLSLIDSFWRVRAGAYKLGKHLANIHRLSQ
jgi:glycosyltransferase involved in cell wall biosynthesis